MSEHVVFDGDNSYPDCKQCAKCCHLNVLAITHEEYYAMRSYIEENNVEPIDYKGECCPLCGEDGRCMIWPARPQICKLYNCNVPRLKLLEINPSLDIPENPPLLNLHEAFINNQPFDPRF